MYKKGVLHVQSCYFANKTYCFFSLFSFPSLLSIARLGSVKCKLRTVVFRVRKQCDYCCHVLICIVKTIVRSLRFRACLNRGGGPQIGEVTCGGWPHLTCKRDKIKMRDYMARRVTLPTRGPPPWCKQALTQTVTRLYILLEQTITIIESFAFHISMWMA